MAKNEIVSGAGFQQEKNAEIAKKKSCFMHIFADNPEIFGAKSNNKNGKKSSRQMAYRAVFTRELAFFFFFSFLNFGSKFSFRFFFCSRFGDLFLFFKTFFLTYIFT